MYGDNGSCTSKHNLDISSNYLEILYCKNCGISKLFWHLQLATLLNHLAKFCGEIAFLLWIIQCYKVLYTKYWCHLQIHGVYGFIGTNQNTLTILWNFFIYVLKIDKIMQTKQIKIHLCMFCKFLNLFMGLLHLAVLSFSVDFCCKWLLRKMAVKW